MRLILSSSVQITERANLPINTLIHSQWWACVCARTLFYTVGYRRVACCICGAYALLLTTVWDWEAVIWCICVELSTVSECVCACVVTLNCYYFHVCLWWVVAHGAYGCLYVHVSGVMCVCARSDSLSLSMRMCALRRLCPCFCHLFFWVGG